MNPIGCRKSKNDRHGQISGTIQRIPLSSPLRVMSWRRTWKKGFQSTKGKRGDGEMDVGDKLL